MPYRELARVPQPRVPPPEPDPSKTTVCDVVVILVWMGLTDLITNAILPTPLPIRAVFWVVVLFLMWFTNPED